ncbi:MAG: undecaprenyl-phosphate glucose phosphotransferase [Geminicoccaceae bacterium]
MNSARTSRFDFLADPDTAARGGDRHRRRSVLHSRPVADIVVRAGDLLMVVLAGLVATLWRFGAEGLPDLLLAVFAVGVLLAAYAFPMTGLYSFERYASLAYQVPRLLGAWALAVGADLVLFYAVKNAEAVSRLWVGSWFVAGSVLLVLWRIAVKLQVLDAQRAGLLTRNLLVIGHRDLLADCTARLDDGGTAHRTVATLALDAPRSVAGVELLRDAPAFTAFVRERGIDHVVLAIPWSEPELIEDVLRRLRHLPIEVSIYPEALGAGIPVLGVSRIGDAPLVRLMEKPIDGVQSLAKAVEDRVLALLLLILLSPVMAVVALLVRLDSPGPVLYAQFRHGFNRRPIRVLKFRTMYAAACDAPDALRVAQATRHDPRVTRIGRILRRTSLDELPQLLNVLRGEMSLVGPRPHAVAHDDHYGSLIDGYLSRHRVKPGITGWAQVNGYRGETRTLEQMRRRIELDLHYIENWSVWLDLRILVRTAFVGFVGERAY